MPSGNCADYLIETLTRAGVERIYGVVGDSLNGVTEALRTQKAIRWVHTRHEEAAAFAAVGESQATGKLAVCAGSCGPGNLHLINGLLALEMKAGGFVETGTDLENPDFAAMANAMGIFARRVEDPGDLPAAAEAVLAHDGPAVIDAVTAKQELSMPPTIKPEEVKGFSLWVLRAVMSGRGDEVLDLAETNLLPR